MAVNPLWKNARSSIRVNREFDSIVTDTSDLQEQKQLEPITSTDEGIIMAVNPLPENVCSSIRVNCEFDSIVTDTSDLQFSKHVGWMNSIGAGIQRSVAEDSSFAITVFLSITPAITTIRRRKSTIFWGIFRRNCFGVGGTNIPPIITDVRIWPHNPIGDRVQFRPHFVSLVFRNGFNYISLLQSSIDYSSCTQPLLSDTIIYRGIRQSNRMLVPLYESMIGEMIVRPGFLSTSTNGELSISKISKEENSPLFGIHLFERLDRSLKSWLQHHQVSRLKID
jgi:hypothetical protein